MSVTTATIAARPAINYRAREHLLRSAAGLGLIAAVILFALHFLVPEDASLHLPGPLFGSILLVAAAVLLAGIVVAALASLALLLVNNGLPRTAALTVAILLAVAILIPALNLLVPAGSFFHVPGYLVGLTGKYLCYALLALSVGLVWGYGGILSLGHNAFFALGGYAMGMYLMRQIGSRGVYGHPTLPDFMVFLNWPELPWYWLGFDRFWVAALMVLPLMPGFAISLHDLSFAMLQGVLISGLCNGLYTICARHLPAAELTLLSLLESVLSPLWVWLVINEVPSGLTLVGGAVVLSAVAVQAFWRPLFMSRRRQPVA